MNEIKIWNYESSEVRTVEKDGEPWFVGKDVTDILGYQNGSRDINRHVDEDDRCKSMVCDGNQDKETIIINESGLYSLILSSKLPTAKKFKRWVTNEVLPAIRKNGVYNTQQQLSSIEMIAAIANNAVETERRLKEAEIKIAETSSKLEQALDVFTESVAEADWRNSINNKINKICAENRLNHMRTRHSLYNELESIANCDLNSRLKRKQSRLQKVGETYRTIHSISKIDVVAEDPKLKAIFDSIVKKLEAKYIQGDNVQMGLVEIF